MPRGRLPCLCSACLNATIFISRKAWLQCQKILDFQDHVVACQQKLVNVVVFAGRLLPVADGSIYRLIYEKLLGDHPIDLVTCTISNVNYWSIVWSLDCCFRKLYIFGTASQENLEKSILGKSCSFCNQPDK